MTRGPRYGVAVAVMKVRYDNQWRQTRPIRSLVAAVLVLTVRCHAMSSVLHHPQPQLVWAGSVAVLPQYSINICQPRVTVLSTGVHFLMLQILERERRKQRGATSQSAQTAGQSRCQHLDGSIYKLTTKECQITDFLYRDL